MGDIPVLGLLGPAGSGKDLVADWFREKGFVKVAFADPIKRFAQRCFGFGTDQLWGPSEIRNQEMEVNEGWWFEAIGHLGEASEELRSDVLTMGTRIGGYLKLHEWFTQLRKDYREKISARVVLQTLGTEWGRSVDPILWVNYAHEVVGKLKTGNWYYNQVGGLQHWTGAGAKGVIIPDHRFRNEVEITQDCGGYVLRLRRLAHEAKNESVGVPGHKSESELKTLPDNIFDLVVEFEEGVDKVHAQLEKIYEEKLWRQRKAANRS